MYNEPEVLQDDFGTDNNANIEMYFQRENLFKGIGEASHDDLILVSDLDEIPNLGELDFKDIKILAFNIWHFKFFFAAKF